MANDKNPVDVQRHLSGVDYPASRQDLIDEANNQDADDEEVSALQNIPDRDYDSPADVTQELGDVT